ncbi:vitamin B12 dependent-methionine synthase activation domain-containing protein [Caproiciproducens faecalis]|uniref:Vitamin B12 dependent methionine synthase activation subunit n=1 Tax=Caproiciproducens faecalis TaxID=2820301 RepID=A0ABS7DP71_9FIRM|nr:vitamin B12 dependent-methionine synthase activation domain-containing protein [Caproiciproducens faecalis]MBW7572993.1 Vitamin B12 dependent methionine synthase activation subunit [Caproiciproducens faecalis]
MKETQEVLRYLGYRGKPADERTLRTIESCMNELRAAVTPRSLSLLLPVEFDGDTVLLGTLRVESGDLRRHLSGCGEANLFAATLGTKADFLLERASKIDMSRAVILQACAAALTESVCDEAEQKLSAEAAKRGLFLRPRYSPGYGDFSILHQRDLLGILQAQKKIGLAMTQDSMLVPTKSVTAVIGLTAEQTTCHIAKCMGCESLNCPFRKD